MCSVVLQCYGGTLKVRCVAVLGMRIVRFASFFGVTSGAHYGSARNGPSKKFTDKAKLWNTRCFLFCSGPRAIWYLISNCAAAY